MCSKYFLNVLKLPVLLPKGCITSGLNSSLFCIKTTPLESVKLHPLKVWVMLPSSLNSEVRLAQEQRMARKIIPFCLCIPISQASQRLIKLLSQSPPAVDMGSTQHNSSRDTQRCWQENPCLQYRKGKHWHPFLLGQSRLSLYLCNLVQRVRLTQSSWDIQLLKRKHLIPFSDNPW